MNRLNLIGLALILFATSCSKKSDIEEITPEIKKELVSGKLSVKRFEIIQEEMQNKTIPVVDPDPGYATIVFFNENDGTYNSEIKYDGEFKNEIEYTLLEGSYKYIIVVADDMTNYPFATGQDLSYTDTEIHLNSIENVNHIWCTNGTFEVSPEKTTTDQITVKSPLGQLKFEVTNEEYLSGWGEISIKVLPMEYTSENKTNTVCLFPGNTETKAMETASNITHVVAPTDATVGDINFSTLLIPHTEKYQIIIEITNPTTGGIDSTVVPNIPITATKYTTVKGKLKEGIDGTQNIIVEEVTISEGDTVDF